ncbi:hypothetical protein TNCV_1718221 [Trichonephila clavipes]|nr:hypothetical protein TNCV_1718221 [Trichonephila clavipes]
MLGRSKNMDNAILYESVFEKPDMWRIDGVPFSESSGLGKDVYGIVQRYMKKDLKCIHVMVTKLAPDAERQVFERYRSGQVALQAEPLIDAPVGSAVSGGREEVGMIHGDTNHCWIFAILRNAGNRQLVDRDRLVTIVKHVGMGEKG